MEYGYTNHPAGSSKAPTFDELCSTLDRMKTIGDLYRCDVFVMTEAAFAKVAEQLELRPALAAQPRSLAGVPFEVYPDAATATERAEELQQNGKRLVLLTESVAMTNVPAIIYAPPRRPQTSQRADRV